MSFPKNEQKSVGWYLVLLRAFEILKDDEEDEQVVDGQGILDGNEAIQVGDGQQRCPAQIRLCVSFFECFFCVNVMFLNILLLFFYSLPSVHHLFLYFFSRRTVPQGCASRPPPHHLFDRQVPAGGRQMGTPGEKKITKTNKTLEPLLASNQEPQSPTRWLLFCCRRDG